MLALSNTQKRNDFEDAGGTSHESKVAYTKQTLPFIADMDYLRYGGRKHPADGFGEQSELFKKGGRWNDHFLE